MTGPPAAVFHNRVALAFHRGVLLDGRTTRVEKEIRSLKGIDWALDGEFAYLQPGAT